MDLEAGGLLAGGPPTRSTVSERIVARYRELWDELTGTRAVRRPASAGGSTSGSGGSTTSASTSTSWPSPPTSTARRSRSSPRSSTPATTRAGCCGSPGSTSRRTRPAGCSTTSTPTARRPDRQGEDEEIVAHDWLAKVFEPVTRRVPRDLARKLEPAEVFHEVLEHRWYMSERAGHDIPIDDALNDYVATVLPGKPDEAAVVRTGSDLATSPGAPPPPRRSQPADVTVRAAYDVPRPRPVDRPWVGVCMVASIDGSTVIDSNSRGLSSTDRPGGAAARCATSPTSFIVGAGTVRDEGYGPPRKPGQRIGVVSRRGDVDAHQPLFTSGAGFLILPEDAPPTSGRRRCAPASASVDLAGALGQLDADFVQAEGGARLNGALLDADVIDELNLTISPQLAGGDGPRVDQRLGADVAADAPGPRARGRRLPVHPLRARRDVTAQRALAASSAARARAGSRRRRRSSCRRWRSAGRRPRRASAAARAPRGRARRLVISVPCSRDVILDLDRRAARSARR